MKEIKNLLLVDDDEATNVYHQIIIENTKFASNIEMAWNGAQALEMISNENFDLIFLDLNMPGVNGWDVLNALSNDQKFLTSGTSLFIVTASINPDDQERAKEFPLVNGFICKLLKEETLKTLHI